MLDRFAREVDIRCAIEPLGYFAEPRGVDLRSKPVKLLKAEDQRAPLVRVYTVSDAPPLRWPPRHKSAGCAFRMCRGNLPKARRRPSCIPIPTRLSSWTGHSSTRGGVTVSDATGVKPATSNLRFS